MSTNGTTVTTTTRRYGQTLTVVAHSTGPRAGDAKTFVNFTQAQRAADKLAAEGVRARVWGLGPAKYLVVD